MDCWGLDLHISCSRNRNPAKESAYDALSFTRSGDGSWIVAGGLQLPILDQISVNIHPILFGFVEKAYNFNMQRSKSITLIWVSRILIGAVAFSNLLAAFQFMLQPNNYVSSFELQGESGAAVIQGMGLLFLMWNVPYIVALLHPVKHYVSLIEAVAMQAIGVVGESLLLFLLQGGHQIIRASVIRFIFFDGGGLVLLLVAFGCVLWIRKRDQ